MMVFKVILFSYLVQFCIFGVSSNEDDIRHFFKKMSYNVLNNCMEKLQILLFMKGCMENFVITFKPYLDFCQSQDLLKIQETEKQSIH